MIMVLWRMDALTLSTLTIEFGKGNSRMKLQEEEKKIQLEKMVYSKYSLVTTTEIKALKGKEGKEYLADRHSARSYMRESFMEWDDAKEIWEPSETRFGEMQVKEKCRRLFSNNRLKHYNIQFRRAVQLKTDLDRQYLPTRTSNRSSPKRPQVNQFNQRRHFSKSYSSVRKPFAKTTAHSHAIKGNWGSAVKTSAGYNCRNSKLNSNFDSGPTFIITDHPLKNMVDRGIFDSGYSRHMTSNKDQLEDFEEFNGGICYLWRNKGIKQEYNNARTPQQNGVAERMNMTLIKAARTMLVDSLLPTTFWAEAVSTACYIFNRILLSVQASLNENLMRDFLVDKPNLKEVGYRWMFDIDYLTDSMNYIYVSLENQANPHAGASRRKVFGNTSTSTPSVNTGSESVNTGSSNPDDSPMPELEIFHKSKTRIFVEASYDEEGVITDFNSLPTKIEVSPTPTLRIYNIHLKSQILGDPKSVVQTRSKEKPKKISEALPDDSWVQAMHEELLTLLRQSMVSCRSYLMERSDWYRNWVYSNIKEMKEELFCQKLRQDWCLKGTLGMKSKLYMDCIKLLELGMLLYQENILKKQGYKRGTNDKTLFIKRNKKDIMLVQVYVDDIIFGSTKKSWCDEFETLMKTEILKKFDLVNVKTTITPMETKVALTKDKEVFDVDVTPKTSHLNAVKRIFKYLKGKLTAPRPLLHDMLLVATTNPSAGQEHPDVAQSQPSPSTIPVPSTSLPPDLKQTKLTMGSAIMKLVKNVRNLEGLMKNEKCGLIGTLKIEEPEYLDGGKSRYPLDKDWDLIRAKIEANAELSKSMLRSELQGENFAKKMVELAWKLSQLNNLSFEEVKEEFDKLVKQVESFAPINFEATKDSLKRFGEELQKKTVKRLKSDEAKDDESTKKTGKRRKQIVRKGLHSNKTDEDES
ncbi:retrovirus-related pol polyprotein from transposon TNT 1-94 [Tanacetum coccineum]